MTELKKGFWVNQGQVKEPTTQKSSITEHEVEYKIGLANGLLIKRIDMYRHGRLIEVRDMQEILDLIADCNQYFFDKHQKSVNTPIGGDDEFVFVNDGRFDTGGRLGR